MKDPVNITVLGSGAWGTALAKHAHTTGNHTTLWCRRQQLATAINQTHENKENLPTITLKGIKATADIACTQSAHIIVLAVPSQYVRETLQNVQIREHTPVLICAKGIESGSLKLMSDVVKDCLPTANIMVLSGPTFAIEVARHLPTAVTLAGIHTEGVRNALSSAHFRIYTTEDCRGAQVAGAIKNIIAIACGIVLAKNFGENAKASLITRALAEITRLAVAVGGNKQTLTELCGVGDLMLTCSSTQSRNMSFGLKLGKGYSPKHITRNTKTVIEGIVNCKNVIELAKKCNVYMPICAAIYRILYEQANIDSVIKDLLSRLPKNPV